MTSGIKNELNDEVVKNRCKTATTLYQRRIEPCHRNCLVMQGRDDQDAITVMIVGAIKMHHNQWVVDVVIVFFTEA